MCGIILRPVLHGAGPWSLAVGLMSDRQCRGTRLEAKKESESAGLEELTFGNVSWVLYRRDLPVLFLKFCLDSLYLLCSGSSVVRPPRRGLYVRSWQKDPRRTRTQSADRDVHPPAKPKSANHDGTWKRYRALCRAE